MNSGDEKNNGNERDCFGDGRHCYFWRIEGIDIAVK